MRAAVEAKKAEEEKKKAEEKAAEEAKEAEGGEKTEEEKAAQEAKKEAAAKEAEEQKKKEEEEKKAKEEKEAEEKTAKEAAEAKKVEEDKKKAEDKAAADEQKKAEEEEKRKKEDEEEKRLDAEMGEAPPAAELSDEEKKMFFPKRDHADLTATALASALSHVSIPDAAEGFDKIEYVWDAEKAAKEYLRSWASERKITTRIEDLQPSEWFKEKFGDWQKALQNWQLLQKEYKSDPVKMASLTKRNEKYAAKLEGKDEKKEENKPEEKKEEKKDEEKKDEDKKDEEMKEGEEKKDEEMKEGEEKKEGEEEEKKAEEEAEPEDDREAAGAIDIMTVASIDDIGNGEPAYLHFAFEDWALVSLRFELHLLAAAFLHDTDDPERMGIHEPHVGFYYQKYFKKQLTSKFYGAETLAALVTMVKDTVHLEPKHNVLLSLHGNGEDPSTMAAFMKLTEGVRRERQRRLDSGDESARLKFSIMHAAPPAKSKGEAEYKDLPQPKEPGAQNSKGGKQGGNWNKGGENWGAKGGGNQWGGGGGGYSWAGGKGGKGGKKGW